MKQIRKAIRRILLENHEHYEKLAIYLTGSKDHPTVESIRAAINLGETLGYITVKEAFTSPTGWNAYFDLVLDPDFFVVALPHLEKMRQKVDVNIIENQNRVQFIVAGKR